MMGRHTHSSSPASQSHILDSSLFLVKLLLLLLQGRCTAGQTRLSVVLLLTPKFVSSDDGELIPL
jgi:hypothetical protein